MPPLEAARVAVMVTGGRIKSPEAATVARTLGIRSSHYGEEGVELRGLGSTSLYWEEKFEKI